MRVCFVALSALPLFDPEVNTPFGGIETRAFTLARGLAQRPGFDVDFVVCHTSPRPPFVVDGVRVHVMPMPWLKKLRTLKNRSVERLEQFPYLRFDHWNAHLLWQLPLLTLLRPFQPSQPDIAASYYLEQFPTDLFCTFGVNANSATVIASAQKSARPVVLSLGSDADLDPGFQQGTQMINAYGVTNTVGHFVLRRATAIVVQTKNQQRWLRERFARQGTFIPNPFDVAQWDANWPATADSGQTAGLDRYVLWVGRTDEFHKRPLLLLELAKRCPEIPFLMVLHTTSLQFAAEIRRTKSRNVTVLDTVPFHQMPALFQNAELFVSTSAAAHEGFPNVFIQAAASGVPIASLEVRPEFLNSNDCGCCADGSLEQLAVGVRSLWQNDTKSSIACAALKQRVRTHYAVERISAQLAKVLHPIGPDRESNRPTTL